MRGNAGVPGSANKALSALYRYVFVSFGIEVSFSESKIDDVYNFSFFSSAHHEVIGLDIAMDEALSMYHFESCYDLYADVECS